MTPIVRVRRELVRLHSAADAVRDAALSAKTKKASDDLGRAIETLTASLDQCQRCGAGGECSCP